MAQPAYRPVKVTSAAAGLTRRAIGVGFALVVAVNLWVPYSSHLLLSSRVTMGHLPVAALFPLLFLILVVNPLLRQWRPDWVLAAPELLLIFAMVFVASLIPGKVMVAYFLGIIATPYYFATPENQWQETFFRYLPDWLLASNRGNAMAWFYEGLPEGVEQIPWTAWVIPLFWWTSFFVVLFFVGACIATIMRKTWVEHERLGFPLARVPVDLIQQQERIRGRWPAFVHDRLFQVGFWVTLGIMVWNIIAFWHLVPPIPIGVGHYRVIPIMREAQPIRVGINVYALGFAFFAPLEILFSLWFFAFFGTLEGGFLGRFGMGDTGSPVGVDAAVKAQFFGGFIMFVLWHLWTSRHHIKQATRQALQEGWQTPGELLSYRTAFLGLIGGLVYISAWLAQSGLDWFIIPVFLAFLFILYLGFARIIAQTGMVFLDLPVNAHHFTILTLGSGNISPASLTTLGLASAYARNWRGMGMGSLAHIDKMASDLRFPKHNLLLVLLGTFVFSLFCSVGYTVYLGYTTTGAYQFGTRDAFGGINVMYYQDIVNWIRNADQFKTGEFIFMLIGAGTMLVLTTLSHRLPGWPLAPVGFTIAYADIARLLVFSMFMAWLIKWILIRFGGVQLYRRAQPCVWGIIIAHTLGVVLGHLVDWLWFPGQGHALHEWAWLLMRISDCRIVSS